MISIEGKAALPRGRVTNYTRQALPRVAPTPLDSPPPLPYLPSPRGRGRAEEEPSARVLGMSPRARPGSRRSPTLAATPDRPMTEGEGRGGKVNNPN